MNSPAAPARDAILSAADSLLARDAGASIDQITDAAGVSRATFYRHFRSRAELLAALDIRPDPDARQRIMDAAIELVGREGLRGMSMDELAEQAGVSRASVYRLFPGKDALFAALIDEYSPLDEIEQLFSAMADQPPGVVLPAVARTLARVGSPRVGLIRSVFFEVSNQTPEALAGAEPRLRRMLGAIAGYMAAQMAAGRLRPIHPLLATQLLIGPVLFHLVTRAEVERLAVLDVPVDQSIQTLVDSALRALAIGSEGG